MRPAHFAVALLSLCLADTVAFTVTRPNVLVIVMDTTRADRCSLNGYERPTTPCLDAFAKDGVTFLDAWSPAGWTGPAHASLFTGLRPEHHGFHDGNHLFLAPEVPTLAERLAASGYATACFTNNDWISSEFGLSRGFAKVDGLYLRSHRMYPWAGETHASALAWAESAAAAKRPFLLFVNDMEPHLPYAPHPAFAMRFVRGAPDGAEIASARGYDTPRPVAYSLRAEEMAPERLALMSDLYDAEIAGLDREIGVLLDGFAQRGLLDSTVVVIAGDHGELLGEHHMLEHAFSLHRAVRHVPLLVRFPGWFAGGRKVRDVVRLEDVMPTLLQICGVPAPADMDGASLVGALPGRMSRAMQGANPGRRAWLESCAPGADVTPLTRGIEAIYDGRFHLVQFSDGSRELYDVAADPSESLDLAGSEPGVVARLAALLR